MAISLKGRNFFALEDFTPEEIRYLLDLAIQLKKESKEHIKHQDYIGEDFLLLFEMNSTRTRCAFETSANDLGMGTTFLSNSHFGNTETIKDSMRVFSEMYSAIGYRGAKHSTLLEMAKDSTIPIINGYTDHQHPTQMLYRAGRCREFLLIWRNVCYAWYELYLYYLLYGNGRGSGRSDSSRKGYVPQICARRSSISELGYQDGRKKAQNCRRTVREIQPGM